jgi:hypothetical protein
MKKYILSALIFSAILSFSCNNADNANIKKTDSLSGNTDSAGSQPVQSDPGPGAANAGNATDTIGRRTELTPRTDSVVRH